ncbi:MAG: BPL-N domain-containing protein [Bacteroidales bacterium]|nr:BPL-N domain-containing protein [Bacteroidales bacterium]
MKSFGKILVLGLAFAAAMPAASAQKNRGYYKDVFMDSGILLTSRKDLPAARSLGLSMEAFISSYKSDSTALTCLDTILQTEKISGSTIDENGILLYPDGAPRFRVVYMNGGKAVNHAVTLGETGRNNYKAFIKAGGSYVGTCAGAFIACSATAKPEATEPKMSKVYMGLWPGCTTATAISKSETDMTITKNSPLLKYYDFGGNMNIENVYHNGGCYGNEIHIWPAGTEVLARYQVYDRKTKREVNGKAAIWALKENEYTGRVICCGSHPEGKVTGENFYLMRAMLEYAMEGNGAPRVKAALKDGESRLMDKMTHENAPEYTRIGDKQYHHYTYDVPKGCDSLVVKLESVKGWKNFDLYLYANSGDFAFSDNAWWRDVTLGVDKTLVIKAPKKGKLYISVFCDTTVEAEQTAYGEQYKGRLEVLNGVPYKITVNPQ